VKSKPKRKRNVNDVTWHHVMRYEWVMGGARCVRRASPARLQRRERDLHLDGKAEREAESIGQIIRFTHLRRRINL
jgi:hypothetical protein